MHVIISLQLHVRYVDATMKPPRRSGERISPCNDPENIISIIWSRNLKPRKGWRFFRSGPDNWTFVPASLSSFDKTTILKYGTRGVHYAYGWRELHEMYILYGENHAPTLFTTRDNHGGNTTRTTAATTNTHSTHDYVLPRVSLSPTQCPDNIQDGDEDDEETVAFSQEQQSEEGDETVVQQDQDEQVHHGDDDTATNGSNDAQGTISSTATSSHSTEICTNVSKILAAIKECNDQITWINDHPEESREEAEMNKKQLRHTKQKLFCQLEEYNNHDQVFL